MKNSPMFEVIRCSAGTSQYAALKLASHGPNNNGCDPDSCTDVPIENCTSDTGDDCIAIKAGRNHDGRRVAVPTQNVIIRNCDMKDGHGALTIGSDMSGNVRNVFVENCRTGWTTRTSIRIESKGRRRLRVLPTRRPARFGSRS